VAESTPQANAALALGKPPNSIPGAGRGCGLLTQANLSLCFQVLLRLRADPGRELDRRFLELLDLALAHGSRSVVHEDVPLAARVLELHDETDKARRDESLHLPKGGLVASGGADAEIVEPQDNVRELKCRVVGEGVPAVRVETLDLGLLKIAGDELE